MSWEVQMLVELGPREVAFPGLLFQVGPPSLGLGLHLQDHMLIVRVTTVLMSRTLVMCPTMIW